MSEKLKSPICWRDYVLEVPNHGIDFSSLGASGIAFNVKKVRLLTPKGNVVPGAFALVRDYDEKVLTMVGEQYQPKQNQELISEFATKCETVGIKLELVGNFLESKCLVCLSTVSTFLVGEDRFTCFYVMSHPHQYGFSTSYHYAFVRESTQTALVVSAGVNDFGKTIDMVETFKVMKTKVMDDYQIRKYLMNVFYPTVSDHQILKAYGQRAYDLLHLTENPTWFDAFQSILYVVDFCTGRDRTYAVWCGWFGERSVVKRKALKYFEENANH